MFFFYGSIAYFGSIKLFFILIATHLLWEFKAKEKKEDPDQSVTMAKAIDC